MSEKLLGAKIEEIDETPAQWKLAGIGLAVFVLSTALIEVPLPLFPDPVIAQMEPQTGDLVLALVLASPLVLFTGIYAGHVMEKVVYRGSDDRSQNKEKSE